MTNKEIWEKIKSLDLDFPSANVQRILFNVIDQYIERVVFVKDHVGLPNFLFFVEKGTVAFTPFAFFDMPTGLTSHRFEQEMQQVAVPLTEVDLTHFFSTQDGNLYIGVGFLMSQPNFFETLGANVAYQAQMIDNLSEALCQIRRFPSWYSAHAVYPKDISLPKASAKPSFSSPDSRVTDDHLAQKIAIKKQIDALLDKEDPSDDDKRMFQELSEQIKKLL